ncbi:MAG: low temperature requirement protein A [Mycobacterium sp.]
MADRRLVWFDLFYDLVFVAALVNGAHLFQEEPTVAIGFWLGATLVVMLVIWILTVLHANLFPRDNWLRRALVLLQMFSVAVAILAIGRKTESLPDNLGFLALGVAFLSIALMYASSDQSRYRREARLVTWSSGLAGAIFIAGAPFAESGVRIEQSIFTAGVLVGCVPVYWTLAGRLVGTHLNAEHFSERLGELLVIVLGESFVEVVIRLDGFTHFPNFPILVVAFLITFATWSFYFTLIEPRQMPRAAGPLRLWFLSYCLLIFGLMAVATRAGQLVVRPWRETFTTLPWIWTVMPIVYISIAMTGLYRISRRYPLLQR